MDFPHSLALLVIAVSMQSLGFAEQPIRVASYNIYFLTDQISQARVNNLKQVIQQLNADVIGLQEIADRSALEQIFDPAEWSIVIDDESDDAQDVAAVVRKPLEVLRRNGQAFDLDADDEDYLFAGQQFENAYPNRRDALCLLVRMPQNQGDLYLVVNHWKSRKGGRDVTDPRREEAARLLAATIEQDFDGKNVVVVGDFNDNPDDRSLNILESGFDNAIGGPEELNGPLLINAMESLVAQDFCSWGTKVVDGELKNVFAGSRDQNNATRGTAGATKPILFDQILFLLHMAEMYVDGSATVFGDAIVRMGNNPNAATPSDHVPVFVYFVLESAVVPPPPAPTAPTLQIAELMVNPNGEDKGHEWVLLKNPGGAAVALSGWKLRDRSNNELQLAGSVPANGELKIDDPQGKMPLNNNGDEVVLIDAEGEVVDRVTYPREAVVSGVAVRP